MVVVQLQLVLDCVVHVVQSAAAVEIDDTAHFGRMLRVNRKAENSGDHGPEPEPNEARAASANASGSSRRPQPTFEPHLLFGSQGDG